MPDSHLQAPAGSSYVFTVWFKGQATHHTANLVDGTWTVNKKPCTGASSIEDVKKYLQAKRIVTDTPCAGPGGLTGPRNVCTAVVVVASCHKWCAHTEAPPRWTRSPVLFVSSGSLCAVTTLATLRCVTHTDRRWQLATRWCACACSVFFGRVRGRRFSPVRPALPGPWWPVKLKLPKKPIDAGGDDAPAPDTTATTGADGGADKPPSYDGQDSSTTAADAPPPPPPAVDHNKPKRSFEGGSMVEVRAAPSLTLPLCPPVRSLHGFETSLFLYVLYIALALTAHGARP